MLFYKANGKKAIRHVSSIKPATTATGGEALAATPVPAAS